jgi:gliding motility associated protien GldN
MKKLILIVAAVAILRVGFSQEAELAPLVKPEVMDSYVMFQKTILRRMDCREKQNAPFYSVNGEISALILEAVDAGLLTAYTSDSLNTVMEQEDFEAKVAIPDQGGGGGGGFGGGGFGGGGFGGGFGGQQQEAAVEEETPKIPYSEFSVLYIKEDVIFDRNRSRMYHYIRSIAVARHRNMTSLYNPQGLEEAIAYFKYEDLLNLFRGPYVDRAIWYNNQNIAAHVNFADAFELRLFRAPITMISNSENRDIRQIYGDKIAENPLNAMIYQQQYEYDLMEYESELWEY